MIDFHHCAFHFDIQTSALPEDSAAVLASVRSALYKYGLTAPLWETESAVGNFQTSSADAPALLARKFLVDMSYGAMRSFWYMWAPGTEFCEATVDGSDAKFDGALPLSTTVAVSAICSELLRR